MHIYMYIKWGCGMGENGAGWGESIPRSQSIPELGTKFIPIFTRISSQI